MSISIERANIAADLLTFLNCISVNVYQFAQPIHELLINIEPKPLEHIKSQKAGVSEKLNSFLAHVKQDGKNVKFYPPSIYQGYQILEPLLLLEQELCQNP